MRTELESQLRDLGEQFRSEMTHVHSDEILDSPRRDTAPDSTTLIGTVDDQRRKTRVPWLAAAAAAAILVLIGGLVMISQRNVPDGSSSQPTPTTSSAPMAEVNPGPPGAMILPDDVEMQVTNATFSDDGSLMNDTPIRWYATEQLRPETGPYLRVLSIEQQVSDDAWFDCAIYAPDGRKVSLADGTLACLEHRNDGDAIGRVFVERTSSLVVIEAQATDDELLLAANHVAPAAYGPGYEVTDPGLPDGVTATGIGWMVSDFAAASLDDASGPMVQAHWEDNDGRSIFYVASRGNFMSNHRLGYDTITDITVRGEPGFIRTYEDQPNYIGVVWQEHDMTYQVGSQRLGEDQLLDLIEQLHLATMDEWDTAAAVSTTAATEPPAPAPTSIARLGP